MLLFVNNIFIFGDGDGRIGWGKVCGGHDCMIHNIKFYFDKAANLTSQNRYIQNEK